MRPAQIRQSCFTLQFVDGAGLKTAMLFLFVGNPQQSQSSIFDLKKRAGAERPATQWLGKKERAAGIQWPLAPCRYLLWDFPNHDK
jgi:hypothetical protein